MRPEKTIRECGEWKKCLNIYGSLIQPALKAHSVTVRCFRLIATSALGNRAIETKGKRKGYGWPHFKKNETLGSFNFYLTHSLLFGKIWPLEYNRILIVRTNRYTRCLDNRITLFLYGRTVLRILVLNKSNNLRIKMTISFGL